MRHAHTVGLAILFATAAVLTGCGEGDRSSTATQEPSAADAADPLVVVASIHPLADLCRSLLGRPDDASAAGEVHTLLPPGATPHGFAPTPRAVATLGEADVLVVAGRGLDAWAEGLARTANPDVTILRLSDSAIDDDDHHAGDTSFYQDHNHHDHGHDAHVHAHDTHDTHDHHGHDHGHHDHLGPNPHLWLDPAVVQAFVFVLAKGLGDRLPEERHPLFDERVEAFLLELDAVDQAYRRELTGVSTRKLVTFHNAFDPLAERYGLEVVAHLAPVELAPGGEVAPARLDAAARAITEHGVPTVYVEPQFNDAAARRLAEVAGVRVLTLDPLGHPEIDGRRTWAQLMRYNLGVLVDGQSVSPASP